LLFITLGLAWLTDYAGLSLALGAFIAGMLISETEFKHQVETDIRPFHDVLLGLFFITIGMMLDWRLVLERWPLVLFLVTVPVLFKLLLVTTLARGLGATTGVSLRTGIYLAQAGEFGFVLLTLAQENALVPKALLNPILASMVLSMLATPFLVMYSNRIVMKLVSSEWLLQSLQMTRIASQSISANKHVIICGYGRCGQNLARLLEAEKIPYIALDLDPDRVRKAAAAGDNVVYGDAVRLQALMAAGLARATPTPPHQRRHEHRREVQSEHRLRRDRLRAAQRQHLRQGAHHRQHGEGGEQDRPARAPAPRAGRQGRKRTIDQAGAAAGACLAAGA
jgi:CPA2 family monovalent cation:H+ antiporter-2